MKTIRLGTFETNSSSTHTLAILPNSAENVPIGQTIELKFTKKDQWDYEIDSNWKLFRLFNSNKEKTLKYLNKLNIIVVISLEDLDIIESEFSWKSFDFDLPFESLDNFISFIWGNTIVDEWDNNDIDEIIENFKQLNSQNYLTEKYNS